MPTPVDTCDGWRSRDRSARSVPIALGLWLVDIHVLIHTKPSRQISLPPHHSLLTLVLCQPCVVVMSSFDSEVDIKNSCSSCYSKVGCSTRQSLPPSLPRRAGEWGNVRGISTATVKPLATNWCMTTSPHPCVFPLLYFVALLRMLRDLFLHILERMGEHSHYVTLRTDAANHNDFSPPPQMHNCPS